MRAIRSPIASYLKCWAVAVVAGAAILWIARRSEAVPLTIIDPIYEADEFPAPPHESAGSSAHIFENSITLANAAYYQAAWDAFNATRPEATRWTLVDGGALPGLSLSVLFDAFSDHTDDHDPNSGVGGVDISIYLGYSGADRDQLIWSQGLYTNYKLNGENGTIVDPYYVMDSKAEFGLLVPPAYPYEYPDQHFYDGPAGPFDSSFFEADAFISKMNFNTLTMTIYDGVEYGFFLHVEDAPSPPLGF